MEFTHTVLQVTPRLDAGGVERTTLEIAEALTAAGGRSVVASAGGALEAELAAAGGELVRLPADTKNPFAMLANIPRLERIARERGAALIHARSRAPAWSALIAARRLGLPFVTTFHGVYSANGPLKRFYNGVMARGDVVIANSAFTRAHVLGAYPGLAPERVVTIHRGVDLARFDPAAVAPERAEALRRAWGLAPEGPPLALLPARLTRWKGHALLLEAAARLGPGRVRLVCTGAGDPGYAQELQARAAQLGQALHLVGHVADMPAALALCDLAVLPSVRPEAFGRSAVEAQAMQRPVIVADHGGLAETLVHGETGLKFTSGDAQALAVALQQLLDMTGEARTAMGVAGRMHAARFFSIDRLKAATLDVYRGLLQRERP